MSVPQCTLDAVEASTAIAAVALAVSLGTAGWQVLKGRPRVRVKLRACLYGDYRSYYGDTWAKALENANKVGGWHVEAALIEVENAGHLPATITLPAIDLGRGRRFSGSFCQAVTPRPNPGSGWNRSTRRCSSWSCGVS